MTRWHDAAEKLEAAELAVLVGTYRTACLFRVDEVSIRRWSGAVGMVPSLQSDRGARLRELEVSEKVIRVIRRQIVPGPWRKRKSPAGLVQVRAKGHRYAAFVRGVEHYPSQATAAEAFRFGLRRARCLGSGGRGET